MEPSGLSPGARPPRPTLVSYNKKKGNLCQVGRQNKQTNRLRDDQTDGWVFPMGNSLQRVAITDRSELESAQVERDLDRLSVYLRDDLAID
ncbi:hypothetical protein RUM43_003940 [Polyplax serrata]|uniref:Uncharacterized protein n=1 Tax=Polyplax serrata TaxID=468196 RepID=A0AAN8PAW9_POLSC